jgi:UDP-glucose 4-epimerase
MPNNFFPIVSEAAIGRGSFVDFCGGDHPNSDETRVRGYIHVISLSKRHTSVLKVFSTGG